MTQFYLNNRPIPLGVAVHHLANALPHRTLKEVRTIIDQATQANARAVKHIADYGLHIGSV